METRRINELKPHPENGKIYGDHADTELIESVRTKGILTPLLITRQNVVISGHRRLDAARKIGLQELPITLFASDDEIDILDALIHSNRQRNKTNEQTFLEGRLQLVIEAELAARRKAEAARRMQEYKKQDTVNLPYPELEETGESRELAAEKIGVSGKQLEKGVAVIEAIEDLEEVGKQREADQLRSTLNNKSVHAAYVKATEAGHIPQKPNGKEKSTNEPRLKNIYTIPEWQALSDAQRWTIIEGAHGNGHFNDQKNDNIEWALWSWNPVTGCKHNCPYCYARDIAQRYQDIYPHGFEPVFLPDRLSMPANTKQPAEAATNIGYRNVFTCSMADLFGRWVPAEWIDAVLNVVRQSPQWNFLFLTKFPIRMAEFDFPDNAWVGTTVDCQVRVKNAEDAFRRVNAKVKWLSCEPLLEPLQFSSLEMFSWIVLGGSSKSTQTPEWRPPREWINEIEYKAHEVGCMVYEKTNLLERIREYPGQVNHADNVLPEQLRYLPMEATP